MSIHEIQDVSISILQQRDTVYVNYIPWYVMDIDADENIAMLITKHMMPVSFSCNYSNNYVGSNLETALNLWLKRVEPEFAKHNVELIPFNINLRKGTTAIITRKIGTLTVELLEKYKEFIMNFVFPGSLWLADSNEDIHGEYENSALAALAIAPVTINNTATKPTLVPYADKASKIMYAYPIVIARFGKEG